MTFSHCIHQMKESLRYHLSLHSDAWQPFYQCSVLGDNVTIIKCELCSETLTRTRLDFVQAFLVLLSILPHSVHSERRGTSHFPV